MNRRRAIGICARIERSALATAAILVSTLLAAGCGVPLMTLPEPAGAPTIDATAAFNEAVTACRPIDTITAELGVSGRVGGRRLRGRLLAGLSAPASAYLDAPAPFGASLFLLAAHDDEATLLLPRDRRVLEHGQPAAILEAITGVPLAPDDLRLTLTGCVPPSDATTALQPADAWRVIPGAREVYLHKAGANEPWQIVAVVHREGRQQTWRAEYRDFLGGLPRTVRLTSADAERFDLRLSLSQVDINVPLDAATFHLDVPPGFLPVTLQELRDAGPLADREPDTRE
jgi:hypothetical protein